MVLSDLPKLQSEHAVIRFSNESVPPFDKGFLWSICKDAPSSFDLLQY